MHGPLYFIIFQSGNSTRREYSMMEIPITFQSDEKGYFDREYFNLKDFVLTSISGTWFVRKMRLNDIAQAQEKWYTVPM